MTSITYGLLNFLGLGTNCQVKFNAIHPKNKDGRALTSCKVKVYAENLFSYIPFACFFPTLTRREIGTFTTNGLDGSFSHNYSVIQLPFQKEHHLQFEFYEESRACRSALSNSSRDTLVLTHSVSKPVGQLEVKDVEVELYELEKEFPQYEVPKKAANLSNQWNDVDYIRIGKASISGKIIDFIVGIFAKIYPSITNDQIEKLQKIQNRKICQETTLDLFLNGIEPSLKEYGRGKYKSEINWDGCELKQNDDLMNAELFVFKNKEGKLEIEKILFRVRGENKSLECLPTDENFNNSLYELNRLALVNGSLAHHLGVHKEGEMYATAIFRHINQNPIRKFIDSFLRGVLPINQRAQENVVTALTESGITFKGAWTKLQQTVSQKCWSDFKLENPICDEDRLSKGSNAFWDGITLHFDKFFEENKQEILNCWSEIEDFSDFLVENSLDLPDDSKLSREGRVQIDEKYKAVRPLVPYVANRRTFQNDSVEIKAEKDKQDIENVKNAFKYISYLLSWKHWTLHVSEEIGLDADFAAFAPTRLEGKERQESIRRQQVIGLTLTNFKDGTIAKNPNRDIYQPLVDHFNREETVKLFKEIGYNPREIFYGTII